MRFRRLPRLFGKSRGQKRDKKGTNGGQRGGKEGTTNEKICDTICVSADEDPPRRAKTDFSAASRRRQKDVLSNH